ncbi:MAG: threonylcarbamoyl-AMP synthase [Clostridiales bacterium]|nr:threonylcarbamoyl-AMP synthase [Clostridiales bacterium]
MKTEIIKLNKSNIEMDKLRYAANVLRDGGLVAFPTETVYGLGANALNPSAVQNIFSAKGRPSDNPLIVHISDLKALSQLVSFVPTNAHKVMEHFWPGPITLVMEKSSLVPNIITAGLNTVAIRMPSHPIAIALIREAGLPIAAPSANTSGKPSPTNASHVIEDLLGKVDVIIDGGSTEVGVESTVLDLSDKMPLILRPGGVTLEQLSEVLGAVETDPALKSGDTSELTPKAPGMKYKHYSPKAEVFIIEGRPEAVARKINSLCRQYSDQDIPVGVLTTEQSKGLYESKEVISMGDRDNPETIAANLFRSLREFDKRGVKVILAEAVEAFGIGIAIMNRMNKAAGYKIIKA